MKSVDSKKRERRGWTFWLQITIIIKVMILHQHCAGPQENIYLSLKTTMCVTICIHEKAPPEIPLHKEENRCVVTFKVEVC